MQIILPVEFDKVMETYEIQITNNYRALIHIICDYDLIKFDLDYVIPSVEYHLSKIYTMLDFEIESITEQQVIFNILNLKNN